MNARGLSLTELLVTSTIFSILAVLLFGTVQMQSSVFREELAEAASSGETRTGLQRMVRELRRAGYDPRETGNFGFILATDTELRFTIDLDEDGEVDPTGRETFAYRFADGQLWRSLGSSPWTSLVRDLPDFRFVYRDCLGRIATAGSGNVCLIQLALGAVGGSAQGSPPKGGGGKGGSESLCFKEDAPGVPQTCQNVDTGPPLGASIVESVRILNGT